MVRELFVVRPASAGGTDVHRGTAQARHSVQKSLRALVAEAYRYADHEVRAIPHHNDDR